ncbi:sodium:solute symporter family protein [Pirellulales bacterium]|nr:sodium:solute symporter family protein [Pirellulales bacterium]
MTQFWIITAYLGLLLVLGYFASRLFTGGKSDYQLASHSIGPFLLLMSIFGTTMTAFALVGSSGEAFREGVGVYGMLASSSGIIHSLCFFVIGVKLWSWGRRYGYTTQIQFFRDRLESDKIGLLLFPILVGLVIPYLLIGVLAAGAVVETMTSAGPPAVAGGAPVLGAFPELFADTNGGVPRELGSLVICAVVLCYVFFGGMRGTAWANAFQTMVFMVLGVVTFYVIAQRLGGEESFMANLQKLGDAIPDDKATRIDFSKTKFFTYLLIPLSVGMFPHLFQHWLTAKSAASFKLPVVLHPIFIMIVWVPCVLIGVWATTELVTLPAAVAENPNRVLPFLVKAKAGPVLGGFLTAGILAAVMSSLDSQFLCLGTMFSTDIVAHYAGEDRFGDRQQVWITRGFIIVIVAVTYFCSLAEPVSVFTLGIWCFSGFASLFPLVFAAVYWRGLTKWGAYAGVLATIAVWAYLFNDADFGRNGSYALHLGAYEAMPVVAIFAASLVTTVVVSLMTPRPSEATLRKFFAD